METPYSRRERVLIALEAVLLFVVAAVFFTTGPARGYEISVYRGFPLYLVGCLALSVAVGFALLYESARRECSRSWLGLTVVLLSVGLFLSLPAVRNYYLFATGDSMFHLGRVRLILESGELPSRLFYPAYHLLGSTVTLFTGLSSEAALYLLMLVFGIAGPLYVYLFARSISGTTRRTLLVALFPLAVVVPGAVSMAPWIQSRFLLLPVLYLTIRNAQRPSSRFKLLLAGALLALVFYHPLTIIYSLVTIAILNVVLYVQSARRLRDVPEMIPDNAEPLLVGIGACVYLWVFSFASIRRPVVTLLLGLLSLVGLSVGIKSRYSGDDTGPDGGGGGAGVGDQPVDLPFGISEGSVLAKYYQIIAMIPVRFIDLAAIFVFRYGITVLVAGTSIVVLIYRSFNRVRRERPFFVASGVLFAVYTVGWVIGFLVPGTGIAFGRLISYSSLAGAIVLGIEFETRIRGSEDSIVNGSRYVTVGLVLVLAMIITLSVVTVYETPVNRRPSPQQTHMQVSGADWVFDRTQSGPYHVVGFNYRRHSQYRPGVRQKSGIWAPPRLGYAEYERYGAGYPEPVYLIVTEKGRQKYPEMHAAYRNQWRFYPRDFERLGHDPTVNAVYTNGEFEVYRAE